MTDLELLKSTFDKLGVKYDVADEVGKFNVPASKRYIPSNDMSSGHFVWDEQLDYDQRLDTEYSWGHAELAFFFLAGKKVCHAGYEK